MARKRHDYWYFKNVLNAKRIKEINTFIEKNYDKDEPPGNAATGHGNEKIKYISTCKMIYWGKVKHLLQDLEDMGQFTNKESFGYDLHPLRNLDYINYNIYSAKSKDNYGWHIDATNKPYKDLKLTLLINLSTQPYEGGTFNIFTNGPYVVNEFTRGGDVLVFRSYLNHMVLPVTKGVRKTLAIFLEGPVLK